jgi:hypothetical protein
MAVEGERLTSRAMASDKIGHHSNRLTYRVPNSSMHWPPKKTNSPSIPIAARTVHLGHGMAMSRLCAGNRPSASMEPWVRQNSRSQSKRVSVLGKVSETKFSSAKAPLAQQPDRTLQRAPALGPFLWPAKARRQGMRLVTVNVVERHFIGIAKLGGPRFIILMNRVSLADDRRIK